MDSGQAQIPNLLDSTVEFIGISIHHIQNILYISDFDVYIFLFCLHYISAFLVQHKNFQEKYFQEKLLMELFS